MMLCVIAGIAILVRRVFPLHEGTNQRFRLAALVAAILFVVHGLVDVSGHRVGTAFAGIFLLGMALRRPAELNQSVWISRLFRLMGILLFASGIAWLVATRYEMSLPGAVGVENEMRKASAASQGRSFSETIQRTTRALEWAPLKWQLYFSRALGKVGARRPVADVLDDFRRARFLEPNAYEVPYEEGVAWLATQPDLSIAAWREALRRVGVGRVEMYGHMLALASQHNPTVRRGLEEIGMVQHDLALVYLQGAAGADFTTRSSSFARARSESASLLQSKRRVRFFSLWSERGDLNELARGVETHPDWLNHAWRAVAKYHSKRNDFRAAFEVVRRFGETPVFPEAAIVLLNRAAPAGASCKSV